MTRQTTIQKEDSIRFGSGKIEAGLTAGSLIDIGAIRGLAFNDMEENVEIKFDNVDPLDYFKNGDRGSFAFTMNEVDFDTLDLFKKGKYTKTNIAGTPVIGASQAIDGSGFDFNDFILLENQNGDGSALSITSVTGSVDGLLVADTDYALVKDGQGRYGIAIIDSATVTVMAQTFTVIYDYTPNSAKKLVPNAFGKKQHIFVKLTHTNTQGKTWVIDMEQVTDIAQSSYPFPADDGDDVMSVEVTLEGKVTKMIDEQSAT